MICLFIFFYSMFWKIISSCFQTYLLLLINIMSHGVILMSFTKTVTRSVVRASIEGQKVVRRWSKMAQLNITLKIERDKQKSYYKEIGEHVHIDKINEVSSSPKIKALRERIVMQERKIARLVGEINALKQINSCTYCGYVSKEDQRYCPKCSRPRKQG